MIERVQRACVSFNPRPRRGGDYIGLPSDVSLWSVSIHAPAGGATNRVPSLSRWMPSFQSTPPQGGRPEVKGPKLDIFPFQSTPPQGGRRGLMSGSRDILVSIHAPAGGATNQFIRINAVIAGFNPRPRRGGDVTTSRGRYIVYRWRFNPRPRRGGDAIQAPVPGMTCSFNPRPRRGGDRILRSADGDAAQFQSTPPQGGRPPCARAVSSAPPVSIHAPAGGAT